jgi:hypothetical protein
MSNPAPAAHTYTAFSGPDRVAHGPLQAVAETVKQRIGKASHADALVFSDLTGKLMEIDFHGSLKDVLKRLEVFQPEADGPRESGVPAGPGRPRLGVVSREVSLLPTQWEWLASQPGGASGALRRLVDAAKRKAADTPTLAQFQERVYRFLSVMAGDWPGYEDVLRALYRRDGTRFSSGIAAWPADVRRHASRLAQPLFKDAAAREGDA